VTKTVLRIGSFPTDKLPGAGLHLYYLQNLQNYKTIFISPELEGNPLPLINNDTLIRYKNFLFKRTRKESKILHQIKRIFNALKFNARCIQILYEQNPDIIHIHSPYYLPVSWMANLRKKKCYMTYHGSDYIAVKNSKFYKYCVKGIDKVFFLGSHMHHGLEKIHGKNKIVEVFNGVNTDQFKDLGLKREKLIIAVGSLKVEKGFDFLIRAFAHLISRQEYTDYKLIIAGDGILLSELKQIAEQLKVDQSISFVGHLDRKKLIALYQKAELFVLSSISEGFPKVLLEAAAAGCKIVSTDVGSVDMVLNKSYFNLVPIKNIELLSLSIAEVLDKEKNKLLKNITQNFSWHKVAGKYLLSYTDKT